MPDYSQLRKLMSHRVRLEFDTGSAIVGYLADCQPGKGAVQFVKLSHAEFLLADGTICEKHTEASLPANVLSGFVLDEGPRGRDVGHA